MTCDRCGRDAVFHQRYSGLRLCGEHLSLSLESRAKRVIRARGWIQQGDRIAVGLSGGFCSSSLLRFLSVHFGMRRDLTLVAITVDEGGRDMARVRGISEGLGIGWKGAALRDLCGDLPGEPPPGGGDLPSPFSRARDRALVTLAGQVGATRLALGTSLDDEADSVFLHVIRGEAARLAASPAEEGEGILFQRGPYPSRGAPAPPWTGGATSCLLLPGRSWLGPEGPQPPGTAPPPSEPGLPAGPGIPVIRPFSRVPEEEIGLFARLNGIDFIPVEKRSSPGSIGSEAAGMLREYTRRHPSALYSLVNLGEGLAGRRDRGHAPGAHGGGTGHG